MFIGLDLGTSNLKGIVIDDAQNICAEASVSLNINRPNDGWSEQNPHDWIEAAENIIALLSKKTKLNLVTAIGLSGQMHGATLLDKNDDVLRPCILWNDTRSFEEASYLDSQTIFRDLTGNIVFPGFTAPKISWVRKHEPKIFDQISKVLLPKDYLRFWLSGEYVAEMSDAAGTSWLDVKKRNWSDALLAASFAASPSAFTSSGRTTWPTTALYAQPFSPNGEALQRWPSSALHALPFGQRHDPPPTNCFEPPSSQRAGVSAPERSTAGTCSAANGDSVP